MTDAISPAMLPDNWHRLLTHELRVGHLRSFRVLFLILGVLLGSTSAVHAATATWNANPESDIAGYILSYGTSPGVHPTSVDVKNVTTWQITTLTPGQTYYFVVQAYNTSALTSVASAEVAFTPAGPVPTIISLSPTSGPVGMPVTISGTNFGATQGVSTDKFNGTAGTPTSWSAGSIVVPVPSSATTGMVVVTVGGAASNGISFTVTVPAPSLTSLSPSSGAVGTAITIAGANFGTTQGTSTVTFNGNTATPTTWSGTSISVPVPSAATTGPVVVTVGGLASNGISFAVTSGSGTITIDLSPQDTFVNLDSINYGTAATLIAYTWPANQVANAILMKFGLSQIPATATIQSATLNANLVGVDAFPAEPTYAVTLNKIVNHNPDLTTATGNTYDGVNAWSASTCCFGNIPMAQADISAARSTTAVDRTLGFKTWDATATVQEWVTTPATNFGLLLNADASKGADHYRTFASMENSVTTARPYLHITYTTSGPATLISPTNGATNVDMTLPMQWTTAAGAQAYYLYVGLNLGTNDLVNTGEIQQTSYLATGLSGGQKVFARLWTKLGGAWLFSDSSFTTAAGTVPVVATLTSPVNGATNVDMTLPMQWTTVAGVQAYYLYVGSTLGSSDLVNTGEIQQTSYLATGLPGAQTVFARLWTKVGGVWRSSDSSFTTAAATAPVVATITSPVNGATNVNMTLPVQWTTIASAQAYYLYVGSTVGANNLVNTGEVQQTSYLAAGLPHSQTVFARLWTKVGGVWRFSDSSFTTAP